MGKKFSFETISKHRGVLMGFQILLIILFHFTEDCKVYDVRYEGPVYWFYNYVRSSGVDAFLFFSGFGLYYSWKKNPDYLVFLKKRFSRILIPYLIVAIPAWAWRDLLVEGKTIVQYIKDVTFVSLFTDGNRWYWYIFMSMVCYLVFPVVFHIMEKGKNTLHAVMRTIIIVGAITVFAYWLREYHYEIYSNISLMILRIPAFLLGTLTGRLSFEKRKVSTLPIICGAVIILILAIPMEMVFQKVIGSYFLALVNICLCLGLIGLLEVFHDKKWMGKAKQILQWFGMYSLELYLLHVMVRRMMNIWGYHTYRYSYECIMVLISLGLSILLKKATDVVTHWGGSHGRLH